MEKTKDRIDFEEIAVDIDTNINKAIVVLSEFGNLLDLELTEAGAEAINNFVEQHEYVIALFDVVRD